MLLPSDDTKNGVRDDTKNGCVADWHTYTDRIYYILLLYIIDH